MSRVENTLSTLCISQPATSGKPARVMRCRVAGGQQTFPLPLGPGRFLGDLHYSRTGRRTGRVIVLYVTSSDFLPRLSSTPLESPTPHRPIYHLPTLALLASQKQRTSPPSREVGKVVRRISQCHWHAPDQ
jgi:hypothetical protein